MRQYSFKRLVFYGRHLIPVKPGTVACPKRQTSFQNGKSTFLSSFSTNVDEIWSEDVPWDDICIHKILSNLVCQQLRKVDLHFGTDVCRLGQATVQFYLSVNETYCKDSDKECDKEHTQTAFTF